MASSAAEQYSHLILNAECDWEDDEHCFTSFEGRGIPKYEVRLDDSASAENVRVIVIAEGPVATDFLRKTFKAKGIGKIIRATIQEQSEDLDLLGLHHAGKQILAGNLFLIEGILVCSCSLLLPEESSAFASMVLSYFSKVQRVIALTGLPMTSFKCDFDLTELHAVSRMLVTAKESLRKDIPALEQPNILTGVVASMMTLCEVKGIPAEVCVVYSWGQELFPEVTEEFNKYLATVPNGIVNSLLDARVKKLLPCSVNGSDLYA